jgi:hypothetical protein
MKAFSEEHEPELEKLGAVCTDGYSSMNGSNIGFISLEKNHPKTDSVVIPRHYSPREYII